MSRIYDALKRESRSNQIVSVPKAVPVREKLETLTQPAEEAYQRMLQGILRSLDQHDSQVLLVTSAVAKEGTSTVARNLARTLCRNDTKKVLLIDANLRNPSQHLAFGVERTHGLSDVIGNGGGIDHAYSHGFGPGLTLITSGRHAASPSQILNLTSLSVAMERLRSQFDWIILDTPPITQFSETSTMADVADGVILVVRAEKTRWEVANQAKKILEKSNTPILGAVLNRRKFYIPKFIYNRL